MSRTIRARFTNGVIEPLEKVDIEEGEEITVTIKEIPISSGKKSAFKRAAGSWKGTIDAEKLIRNIYQDRLISTRKVVRL